MWSHEAQTTVAREVASDCDSSDSQLKTKRELVGRRAPQNQLGATRKQALSSGALREAQWGFWHAESRCRRQWPSKRMPRELGIGVAVNRDRGSLAAAAPGP